MAPQYGGSPDRYSALRNPSDRCRLRPPAGSARTAWRRRGYALRAGEHFERGATLLKVRARVATRRLDVGVPKDLRHEHKVVCVIANEPRPRSAAGRALAHR